MTNRRRLSRSAAAPSHDIPRPSLDADLTEAQLSLGWNVLCASGQKIESERDSDLTVARFSVHSIGQFLVNDQHT